tara:strand:+ start:845 stop:1330 length:486 start_codon:yes stop_codon:yes gene_type:complete
MKKYLLIFIILFPLNSLAENLAVVDINYLVQNSKLGKSINSSLEKTRKKISKDFEDKEKKFKEKNKSILVKKKLITEAEFNKTIQELQNEVSVYNKQKQKTLEEFKKNKAKEYTRLYKEINKILIDYSKKNNVNTVIDKKFILISKTENDITSKILEIMNN